MADLRELEDALFHHDLERVRACPLSLLRRRDACVRCVSDDGSSTTEEMRGAPLWSLHVMGVLLVLARVMHAFGSNRGMMADGLRFLGAQLTYLVLTLASFICLYIYAMPKPIF